MLVCARSILELSASTALLLYLVLRTFVHFMAPTGSTPENESGFVAYPTMDVYSPEGPTMDSDATLTGSPGHLSI